MQLKDNDPFLTVSNDIDLICRPLKRLGIVHFTHARYYHDNKHDNKMTILCNNPRFTKYCFSDEKPDNSIHDCDLEKYHLWSDYCSPQFLAEAKIFNVHNCFEMSRNEKAFTDYFVFGPHTSSSGFAYSYFNLIDILEKFIDYFVEKSFDM